MAKLNEYRISPWWAAGFAILIIAIYSVRLSPEKLIPKSKSAEKEKPTSPIVAMLNGEPITREDIIRQKVLMDSTPGISEATRAQALEVIVRNKVIFEEAKRRGLAMSLDEARAIVSTQRQMYDQGTLPERDKVTKLIKGFNVDPALYWEEIAPQQYAMMTSIMKWYQDIAKTVDIAYIQVGKPSPTEMARQGSAIDQTVQGLVSKAKLDIVDKAFIGE